MGPPAPPAPWFSAVLPEDVPLEMLAATVVLSLPLDGRTHLVLARAVVACAVEGTIDYTIELTEGPTRFAVATVTAGAGFVTLQLSAIVNAGTVSLVVTPSRDKAWAYADLQTSLQALQLGLADPEVPESLVKRGKSKGGV